MKFGTALLFSFGPSAMMMIQHAKAESDGTTTTTSSSLFRGHRSLQVDETCRFQCGNQYAHCVSGCGSDGVDPLALGYVRVLPDQEPMRFSLPRHETLRKSIPMLLSRNVRIRINGIAVNITDVHHGVQNNIINQNGDNIAVVITGDHYPEVGLTIRTVASLAGNYVTATIEPKVLVRRRRQQRMLNEAEDDLILEIESDDDNDGEATVLDGILTETYEKKYELYWPNCANILCLTEITQEEIESSCNEDIECSGVTYSAPGSVEPGMEWGCLKRCGNDETHTGYSSGPFDYWVKGGVI